MDSLKLKSSGVAKVALQGDGVRRLIAAKTEAVGSALAAEVGAENVSVHNGAGKKRARGYVWRLDPVTQEVADGALARALRGAR